MKPVIGVNANPDTACLDATTAANKAVKLGAVVDFYGVAVAFDASKGEWNVAIPFRAGGRPSNVKVQHTTDSSKYFAGTGGILAHGKLGFLFVIGGVQHFFGVK